MSRLDELQRLFLACERFAVVGASTSRAKFGNKVLRCYQQHDMFVTPINPKEKIIEGLSCASSLDALEPPFQNIGVSVVTPPSVTLAMLEKAKSLGINRIWLQPGSESPDVMRKAAELGLDPIAGGPCLLVALGFDDEEFQKQHAEQEGSQSHL